MATATGSSPVAESGAEFGAELDIEPVGSPNIPLSRTAWRQSHRLIASRYPTVGLYDRIADPADLEVVFAIEALTNARLRDEVGQLELVPPAERISGAGSTVVMAAFTHLNPEGSRFSDGGYGVYYAADDLETAVAEVSHHRALFMSRTAEPAMDIDLRLITASLNPEQHLLHDLHPLGPAAAAWLDPVDYAAPQRLGRRLHEAGSWAVLYPSVRHEGGSCVGVFRPRLLQNAKAAAHIALHWDGRRISHWYEKRAPHPIAPST